MSASDPRLATEILAQFTHSASARFDLVLAGMPLDAVQQRELKYWQRQSLIALRDYAATALPGALAAIAAAEQDAAQSLEAASRTWEQSRPPASTATAGIEPAESDTLEQRRRSVAARLASGA